MKYLPGIVTVAVCLAAAPESGRPGRRTGPSTSGRPSDKRSSPGSSFDQPPELHEQLGKTIDTLVR